MDVLAKISEKPSDWPNHLHAVLWADRITTRQSTGYPPFYLVYGWDCVLPIEISTLSWATTDWEQIKTTADLLFERAKQLERRESELEKAEAALLRSRMKNKAYFDANRRARPRSQNIVVGDLVLLHNTRLVKQHTDKFEDRWLGPYRVTAITALGTYKLAELDGTPMTSTATSDRVKKFYPRDPSIYREKSRISAPSADLNQADAGGGESEGEEEEEEEQIDEGDEELEGIVKRTEPKKDWTWWVEI
jgi:hypothetical protein